MNATPPAASHSTHDELTIARLFAGDVDEAQRALAVSWIESCGQCADLFAGMAADRSLLRTMPAPARPRDFRLTAGDAARLRRRRLAPAFGTLLRWTRPLGGALMAAGLAGVLLTANGVIGSGETTAGAPAPGVGGAFGAPVYEQAATGRAVTNGSAASAASRPAADVASVPSAAYAALSPAGGKAIEASPAQSSIVHGPSPTPPATATEAAASNTALGISGNGSQAGGGGAATKSQGSAGSSSGLPVAVALGLSIAAILAGFALLMAPFVRRRASRTS